VSTSAGSGALALAPRRRKLHALLVLPHLSAVLAVVGATALFGLLATDFRPPAGRFALLIVSMLGGQLAVGALNEWCDRAADAVAKPHKPIPRGEVTPAEALGMAGGGLALLLGCGAALGWRPLAALAFANGWGLAYDLGLKRTPLSWLPYLIALPLVPTCAWLALRGFAPRLLWLYPIGALLVIAIHLAQTLPDIEGDRGQGERGLAVTLGRRRATALLWGAALLSVAVVGVGGGLFGGRPWAALLAAGVALALLLATLALGARARAHWFEALAACAIALALGWVAAVG
jgi:4-hydroxybenzoate polyprenyltransferase